MAQLKIEITASGQTVARLDVGSALIDLRAKLIGLAGEFAGHPQTVLSLDARGRFAILEASPPVMINEDRVANTVLVGGDCLIVGPFTITYYEATDQRMASDFAISELLGRIEPSSPPAGLTLTPEGPEKASRSALSRPAAAAEDSADALWQSVAATLPCAAALWLRFDHDNPDELKGFPKGTLPAIHLDLLTESLSRPAIISHRRKGQQGAVTARPLFLERSFYGWLISHSGLDGANNEAPLALAAKLLAHFSHNRTLSRKIPENFTRVLSVLISTLEAKDTYTAGHSKRVGEMCADFGRYLGLSPATIGQLGNCGALHDIGKIGIPDAILKKPMPLTKEEFQEMKLHPVIGAAILWRLPGSRSICPGVRHHHEKWDGSGYPDGLAGGDIPFFARIVALVDSYDALVSGRTYSGFVEPDKAVAILAKDKHLFDPKLLTAFIAFRKAATLSKGTDSTP